MEALFARCQSIRSAQICVLCQKLGVSEKLRVLISSDPAVRSPQWDQGFDQMALLGPCLALCEGGIVDVNNLGELQPGDDAIWEAIWGVLWSAAWKTNVGRRNGDFQKNALFQGFIFRFHFCFWLCNQHKSHAMKIADQLINEGSCPSCAGWSFPTFPCRKNGSRPLNSGCILIYSDGTGSPEVTAATASSIEDAGKALPLPSAAGHLVLGELGGEFIRPPGWSHCTWGCENQAEQRSRPLVWNEPCQMTRGIE